MGFFKALARGAATVVKVAAPVAIAAAQPEALINNAVAAGVKHLTGINNQTIPGLNVLLSSGAVYVKSGMATGNWGPETIVPAILTGGTLAASSTAIHQTAKINVKQYLGKSL